MSNWLFTLSSLVNNIVRLIDIQFSPISAIACTTILQLVALNQQLAPRIKLENHSHLTVNSIGDSAQIQRKQCIKLRGRREL